MSLNDIKIIKRLFYYMPINELCRLRPVAKIFDNTIKKNWGVLKTLMLKSITSDPKSDINAMLLRVQKNAELATLILQCARLDTGFVMDEDGIVAQMSIVALHGKDSDVYKAFAAHEQMIPIDLSIMTIKLKDFLRQLGEKYNA